MLKEQMREAIMLCQSLPDPWSTTLHVRYLQAAFGSWAGGWAFVSRISVIVAAGALYVYLPGDLRPSRRFYGVVPPSSPDSAFLHRLARLGMEDLQWVIAAACLIVTRDLLPRRRWRCCSSARDLSASLPMATFSAVLRSPCRYPPCLSWRNSSPRTGLDAGKLFLFFLAGSLTFGERIDRTFLEQGLVQEFGWLDRRQFLDRGRDRC